MSGTKTCANCRRPFHRTDKPDVSARNWDAMQCCSIACAGAMRSVPAVDRFERLCVPEPNTGCVLWIGATSRAGYGSFWDGGRFWRAHRWAYAQIYSEQPSEVVLMHRCDTPCCVNPDHLSAGTQADNLADMRAKKRHGSTPRKITDEQVAAIRASKARTTDLARQYGISPGAISEIRHNKKRRVP